MRMAYNQSRNAKAAGIYSSFQEFFMDFVGEELLYPSIAIVVMVLFIVISLVLPNPRKKNSPVALNSEKWIDFSIIEIEEISHDVKRFRFALQSAEHMVCTAAYSLCFQFRIVMEGHNSLQATRHPP